MGAKIIIGGKEHNATIGMTICDVVHSIRFSPDIFIFVIDGKPVPMDTPVFDGAVIKAIKVASGG
jgi:sulfur carrier protein